MTKEQGGSGLSLSTLLIASVSSAIAAIVVSQIWRPGAIIGAAVTPVIVTLTSELLRRAPQTMSGARSRAPAVPVPPREPVVPTREPPPRDDRFGIWTQAEGPSRRRRALRLAIAGGLVAFVIGAVALTTVELVFGGAVGGGERTTVFGGGEGGGGGDEDEREQEPATTDEGTETAPQTTPTTTDGETTPQEGTTTTEQTTPTEPETVTDPPPDPTTPTGPTTPEPDPPPAPTTPPASP